MTRTGPKDKYPWSKWFSAKIPFNIQQGKDFTCAVKSMDVWIRQKSLKLGVIVSIQTVDERTLRITVKGAR